MAGKRQRTRAHGRSAFRPPKRDALPEEVLSKDDLWREIEQLRSEMKELRASFLPPRFGAFDLSGLTAGNDQYFDLGFQPSALFCLSQFDAGAVATFSVGHAVYDEQTDGNIKQFVSTIRRSVNGQWRNNHTGRIVGMLAGDDDSIDQSIEVTSFDPSGFTFNVFGTQTNVHGFAIGR